MLSTGDLTIAMVAGPDAYERIQRDGREIRRLPIQEGKDWVYPASVRQEAEALGFVFGEKLDDLFIEVVKAPDGWVFQSTDHSLYTSIVDDKGRIRGQMGARTLYDTFADYHWHSRYVLQDVREEGWFEKYQPTRLTKTVKRKVLVDDGSRLEHPQYRDSHDPFGGYVYHHKEAPGRYEMVDVEVALPDAKQPKPQPYWQAKGILDRETGEHIFLSEKMIQPPRDSPSYMKFDEREAREKELWAVAAAELDRLFPNHKDITAYWS
ncbi:hypothetical protein BAJUN_01140 [Bajunvirus bajun]|uniref:Uncharacterized protein n=1 Tax=Brevundimonas phage vB_BgoS-Bajun TaxID=2948594 RepID=A0A9E7N7E4_9CAUD|nr:hypothetical protein BAJUN_01140 [Brevundimonas phage vB_BgoS-Bajun]